MHSIGKIGVLLPEIIDPLDYELLRGIHTEAAALGYDVIEKRIGKAKQLLEFSDLRIQEIALQCGYHNESHFIRQFKVKVGMTALRFRQSR